MPAFTSQELDFLGKMGMLWCSLVHDSPMWPIHGQYECRLCGRRHRVPWAEAKPEVPSRQMPLPSLAPRYTA
jgi:hypothetical protein